MGEINVKTPVSGTSYWPPYMSNLLREVVQSWVTVVESGVVAQHVRIGEDLPTTEHLRIAKAFLFDFDTSEASYETRYGADIDPAAFGAG